MGSDRQPDLLKLDPRVYLAVERTYLAWIRTGLAMMGFGFVVARFGLFMNELNAMHADVGPMPSAASARFGIALVIMGVVLAVYSVLRYLSLLKRISRGETLTRPSRLAVSLGAVLAVVGSIVSGYLLLTY